MIYDTHHWNMADTHDIELMFVQSNLERKNRKNLNIQMNEFESKV
jgi:hypothetical protein